MMLCGVKFNLDFSIINQLLENPNLEFMAQVNLGTSEVFPSRVWTGSGMTILIKSRGYGYIKGSLHKFKNGGLHNYDDFKWNEVLQTIENLSDTLNLNVKQLKLVNLEWGLNIETELPPKSILSGLVCHKVSRFEKMYISPGSHFTCSHSQFSLKGYDKGTQHRLPFNLLRFEVAGNKSAFLNNLGIETLKDIERKDVRVNLQNYLHDGVWKDIILIDPKMMDYLPDCGFDYERILKWSNPNFWINATNRTRCYQKKEYDKFRLAHGFNIKEEIMESFADKFKQL